MIGIDPGTYESAIIALDKLEHKQYSVLFKVICDTDSAVEELRYLLCHYDAEVSIEFLQSYGQRTGESTFLTALAVGRFVQVCLDFDNTPFLYVRSKIKGYITGISRPKDADVSRALKTRFGGTKKGELLHGVGSHLWSAMAVAIAHADSVIAGEDVKFRKEEK